MKAEWSSSAFGGYMNSLLKRYFAEENLISPAAVELRAAWRTPRFGLLRIFSNVYARACLSWYGIAPNAEYWGRLFGQRVLWLKLLRGVVDVSGGSSPDACLVEVSVDRGARDL